VQRQLYIYQTKHSEHKNEPYRRQVYFVFVMAQLQPVRMLSLPGANVWNVLHNSYQDVRCRYCLIMWNKGEDSLSVVWKDLIYCHMISGPCPCKNCTVAHFYFFYLKILWNLKKLCVMLIVTATSVVEQTGRWMDSLSHKADYKLYGFWTALDLKRFLLGGISENLVQHRHKNNVLMKYVRGEVNSCEVEYIYNYTV